MFCRPAEAVHEKAAKSVQRVVPNYSATLIVFRAFPHFQGKCQAITQEGALPAFPNHEGFQLK
jgi:hypothetical protein